MAVRRLMKEKSKIIPTFNRKYVIDRISLLDNQRDRALIAFLYLTACRVSEVVPQIVREPVLKDVLQPDGAVQKCPVLVPVKKEEGMRKGQIEIQDRYWMVTDVRTLKRRKKGLHVGRLIPLGIKKEKDFLDFVYPYISNMHSDEVLFPITRQRVFQIAQKIGFYPHLLRHIRCSHLVKDYHISAADLKLYIGWSNISSFDTYVHLDIKNLMQAMEDAD